MPGIAPTHGWGYEWGNGPVSDGILFELPWQVYRHTALIVKFYRIAVKASEFADDNESKAFFEKQLPTCISKFQSRFLNDNGSSKISEQTALAFIIAQKLAARLVKKPPYVFLLHGVDNQVPGWNTHDGEFLRLETGRDKAVFCPP